MGFERNYEHEQIFTIREGKVIGKKDYHNYVVDGFAFDKVTSNTDIRKLFPLKTEKYPELANVKRIIFNIRQARVEKAYHPWKVSFINGEFRAFGIEHYSFPYPLDQ